MQTTNNETTENPSIDFQKKNLELRDLFLTCQNDFKKRKELREKRLKQINEYREEQVAALKH